MSPHPILSEYYGDSTRWFIATVVNSTPPAGYEGRVKIRIHGLHSENTQDIPEDHLPWAQCVLPTTEGGVSGIGKIPKILPSALVFGLFMDGKNSQTPIVLGSMPTIERPSQVQLSTKQSVFDQESLNITTYDIKEDLQDKLEEETKQKRQEFTIQFFLNSGLTYNQTLGITENLFQKGMISGGKVEDGPYGIAGWTGVRLRHLKEFDSDFSSFSTQLEFIMWEFNGTMRDSYIRLLETNRYGGDNGSFKVFAKYYLKESLSNLRELRPVNTYNGAA
jgi:hypothetical protein